MNVQIADIPSPIGLIRVASTEAGLVALNYVDRWDQVRTELERRFEKMIVQTASDPHGSITRIERYLNGDIHALENLPVDPGGTAFQKRVWKALRTIPPGQTISY
jgi:O6-methylguanine-DNA--protein-cysteine methyltransferase